MFSSSVISYARSKSNNYIILHDLEALITSHHRFESTKYNMWNIEDSRQVDEKKEYYNIRAKKKILRIAFKYNCNATIAMIWNVGLIWSRKSALFSLSFSVALGLLFHILNYCDLASYIGKLICIKTNHINPRPEAQDTLWKSILVLLLLLL